MAIACLRLFTFPPLPPGPERKVPSFFRRMALSTVLLAPLLYLRPDDFFFLGMRLLLKIRENVAVEGCRVSTRMQASLFLRVFRGEEFEILTTGGTELPRDFMAPEHS